MPHPRLWSAEDDFFYGDTMDVYVQDPEPQVTLLGPDGLPLPPRVRPIPFGFDLRPRQPKP